VCAHGEGVLQRQHMCLERERGSVCHGGHDKVVCEKYICGECEGGNDINGDRNVKRNNERACVGYQ
jgi:hypothetical protein